MSKSSKLVATKPAARKSSAAILAVLAPAPNAHKETAPVKVETFVDQALVESFLTAEASVSDAAIQLFRACVYHRVTPAQFGERSDAKVRASEFNCAHVVAKALTVKGALAIIDKAAKLPGAVRQNVLAALRNARVTAKQLSGSALKGAALTKEITKRADAASAAASATNDAKKAASRAVRTPAAPKAGTLAELMPTAMLALIDLQKQLGKVNVPARMLRKVEDFSRSLAETIELAGVCNDA